MYGSPDSENDLNKVDELLIASMYISIKTFATKQGSLLIGPYSGSFPDYSICKYEKM